MPESQSPPPTELDLTLLQLSFGEEHELHIRPPSRTARTHGDGAAAAAARPRDNDAAAVCVVEQRVSRVACCMGCGA